MKIGDIVSMGAGLYWRLRHGTLKESVRERETIYFNRFGQIVGIKSFAGFSPLFDYTGQPYVRVLLDFEQISDGEEVTPQMDGYLMKCCDCGLVHRMEFRAIEVTEEFEDGVFAYEELDPVKYRVQMKAERVNEDR